MEDLDWGDVPPLQRPEVRRRVAILDRFVALTDPTAADRKEAMEELGLSRPSFYNLVRVWREKRDARLLQGARAPRSGKPSGIKIDKVVASFIEIAIGNIGAAASTADVYREVQRLCTQTGLTPPSMDPVRARHLEVAKWLVASPDARLIVDYCALRLPTRINGQVAFPVLTAAFLEPEGLIVGFAHEYRQPTCAETARALLTCISGKGVERTLTCHRLSSPAWNTFSDVFTSVGLDPPLPFHRRAPGHDFRRLVGTGLGGIKLAMQSTLDPTIGADAGRTEHDRTQSDQIIHDAVDAHNRSRGLARSSDLPLISVGAQTSGLRDGLKWILRAPEAILLHGAERNLSRRRSKPRRRRGTD